MNGTWNKTIRMMRGAPGLLMRSRRRGSFLVLVVGTLAMLSIIMIVYVAVGNSDKRASTSLERRNRSDEIITLFSDYVAQIIADDAVAVAPDPSNGKIPGNAQSLYMREAWDAPTTNWAASSSVNDPTDAKFFRAIGAGDDPWLASTTPTWINFDPAASGVTFTGTDGDKKTFAKRRDWLHISNIAPDGRFVNLYNLRNNYDAKPGTSNLVTDLRMNGELSLTDQSGAINANTGWKKSALGSDPIYQNPSTFDSWQVGAFRPARGPFKNGGTDILPDKAEYPPYQWADADGDGFFDSRWFEMVDSRDAGNGSNVSTPQFFRNLLPTDPNYRWVFAARIVDLSSLVNVNTAGDSNANPNDTTWADNAAAKPGAKTNVVGLSPADIDLRRLLTMRDASESVLDGSMAGTIMIDGKPYNGGYSAIAAPPNGKPASQDYSLYDDKPVAPRSYGVTQDLGWGAYESLRATLNLGRPPGRFSNFTVNPLKDAHISFQTIAERRDFYKKAAPAIARPAYRDSDPAKGDLTQLYASGGGLGGVVSGAIDYGLAFRLNNLIELLTFRSVNDSQVNSTLESALGGQLQSAFSTAPTATDTSKMGESFGPLRENRSLELERENLAYITGANAGQPTEAAMLKSYTDLRQYLTTLSGARPIIAASTSVSSIDHPPALSDSDLATYVPNDPTAEELFPAYATALMPGLPFYKPQGPTVVDIWKDLSDPSSKEFRGMFYGGQGPITALLAAGHMAANFASGAQPQTGTVSRAPYVLVMAEPVYKDAAGSLPQDTVNFTDWKQYFPSWWSNSDRRLNLARFNPIPADSNGAKLSVNKAAPIPAPAVNIYGMGDPHPFLVEAATYTVYRDVYNTSPLRDGAQSNADAENLSFGGAKPNLITINGKIDVDNNPDFILRLIAIKLHNPYGVAIQLSSAVPSTTFKTTAGAQWTANSPEDFFYLRVGSGTDATNFVLTEVDETIASGAYDGNYSVRQVVMQPGETIVFYALNRDLQSVVEDRFNPSDRLNTNQNQDPAFLEDWLIQQIGPKSGTGFRRIQMARVENDKFNSRTSVGVVPATFGNSFTLVPPSTVSDHTISLWRAARQDSGILSDVGGPNNIMNDQLCDRIHNDGLVNLDRQLVGITPGGPAYKSSIGVDDMWADPANKPRRDDVTVAPTPFTYNGTSYNNYNSRFTIALSSHISRKSDPAGANLKPGMIPAWAIDPKDADGKTWYAHEELPDQSGTGVARGPLKLSLALVDAFTTPRFSHYSPRLWRGLDAIFPSMPKPVSESSVAPIGPNNLSQDFDTIRRELAINGNRYQGYKADLTPDGKSQIRPTDLLNVMAIGSTQIPIDITGTKLEIAPDEPDLMKQWTTTAEALAIAMGYANRDQYDPAKGNTKYGPLDLYYFDLNTAASTDAKPLFDSGYLKLDDFVAVRYDASDNPYTAGTGTPIAGNILSMFRVQPDSFANLNIATPGLVNINTAPQAVLRVLPFTFPSTNELADTAKGQQPSTFWPSTDGSDVEAQRVLEVEKTDIAAMIESYRDKIAVELRPKAKTLAAANPGDPTWFAGFFDRTKGSFTNAGDQDVDPNSATIGDYINLPAFDGGRYWSTGLKGIREGAGFQSVGELLAVRHALDPVTGQPESDRTKLEKRTSNIDFLGHRPVGSPTNLLGTDNILEQVVDPTTYKVTDVKPLQFGHTYQDKLKILSGLLGSISVRSDMYAVWFVARGYQRSDVEGLPALQPMVPSVERRFLMIIDRSNVTKVGQKPRVLAFVELPL
ncbi:MAG: hypothetical protein KF805_03475 [Phycisphaeraceae bacterium]|nr:hypothetical protein [Phycisphaeraceae bacterium]